MGMHTRSRALRVSIAAALIGLLALLLMPAGLGAATPTGAEPAPPGPTKSSTAGSGGGAWNNGGKATLASTVGASSGGTASERNGGPAQKGTSSPAANAIGTTASSLQYYPLAAPIRFLDTRPGASACVTPGAPHQGGAAYIDTIGTCGGSVVPGSAIALTGNVTVVADAGGGPGFVTLYPDGSGLPSTSNANYLSGDVIPNAFIVALGTGSAFRNYASTTIDIIVDITGYFAPVGGSGLYFHRLPSPIRYLDTRPGNAAYSTPGTPDSGGGTYSGTVAGISYGGVSIPSNATAIAGNATVVADQNAGSGFLTLFPRGGGLPNVSNNNYLNGKVIPNAFFVGLGGGGISAYNSTTINVIIDISGYFSASASDVNGAGVLYNTLAYPIRMYDSRPGSTANGTACFGGGGALDGGVAFIIRGGGLFNGASFTCQGISIPTSAVAVTGNATVVADQGSGPGFVTLYQSGTARPLVSNLNYMNGSVIPNFFISAVGPVTAASGNMYTNAFNAYASTTVNEIFDLNGYFA